MATMPEVLKLTVRVAVEMSLWEAIKLRVAGATYLHEYIKAKLEQGT